MARRGSWLLLALCSCGVALVDATPPALERRVVRIDVRPVEEPVVYGVVFDLDVPEASACARAKERLVSFVREAFAPVTPAAIELGVFELSPGCRQRSARRIDAWAYSGLLATARASAPGRALRPVLVYFNNVDLPLPRELAEGLEEISSDPADAPHVWAITAAKATLPSFGRVQRWTHSADASYVRTLAAWREADLPFVSGAPKGSEPLPLLDPPALARVRELKVCAAPEDVELHRVAAVGQAARIDRAWPPLVRVAGASPVAVLRRDFPGRVLEIELEACIDRCDRYIDAPGEGVPWSARDGCLGSGP